MTAVHSHGPACHDLGAAEAPAASARKWIFCVLRFCEACLLAALTVSAVPAVIDEPGGALYSPGEEREREIEGGREAESLLPSLLVTLRA